MKIIATIGKSLPRIAALPLAASVLTACGGGSAYEAEEGLGSKVRPSLTAKTGQRATAYGDFNPDIWNEHKWYECDCSRDPSKPVGG